MQVLQTSEQKKAVNEAFLDRYRNFGNIALRDFTMLFVESRGFLFYPARDVGGSVFNPDAFRFSSRQELHGRPVHKRHIP